MLCLHNVVLWAKGLLSCEIMVFLSGGMATLTLFLLIFNSIGVAVPVYAPYKIYHFCALDAHSSQLISNNNKKLDHEKLLVGSSLIVGIYRRNLQSQFLSHHFVALLCPYYCRILLSGLGRNFGREYRRNLSSR